MAPSLIGPAPYPAARTPVRAAVRPATDPIAPVMRMTGMTSRIAILPVAAALLMVPAQGAHASTFLGSPNTAMAPTGFACAMCAPGASMGLQQFALRGATVEAPEDGVLVSASVHAKRIAGTADPQIAVLRPVDAAPGAAGVTVAGSAPLPVTVPAGAQQEVEGLHLPVKRGDSVGFLFAAGEVDVGVRVRPRPDGAVQSFTPPCGPCGSDGGTGVELLLDAVVEPDVDQDGLGDESQDPDGGGLGMDWESDWFEDFEAGDQLDEDAFDEQAPLRRRRAATARPRPQAQPRRRDRAAEGPARRAPERLGHAARRATHRRRAVPHDSHGRHAGQAAGARAPAPEPDAGGRPCGRAPRAPADQGRRRARPAQRPAQGPDALGAAIAAPLRRGCR